MESISLYKESRISTDTFDKYKLTIFPSSYVNSIVAYILKSFEDLKSCLKFVPEENSQCRRYAEISREKGDVMAVSYRRFLYQNIRRGLNAMDDSKSFMVFDQIDMAVTNAALDKLKGEYDPDLDAATLQFINDFAEDISNSKLVADLISDDQQPETSGLPKYSRKGSSPTAMDSFNTYITQLGSPRHLLESLAVAAANWEEQEQRAAADIKSKSLLMRQENEAGSASSVDKAPAPGDNAWEEEIAAALMGGGELSMPDLFQKYPALFNEIQKEQRSPSLGVSEDDPRELLFDPADIPSDEEDEDEDTDFVFRILGAASPQERQKLIASAAEELDDGLGSFPRRALSDKFRQLTPPPPTKGDRGGAAAIRPDNVNVTSVLTRLLRCRESIASELADVAEAIRPLVEEEMARFSSLFGVRNSPPTLTFVGPTQLSGSEQQALTPAFAAIHSQRDQQSLYRYIYDPRSNSTLQNREEMDDDDDIVGTSAGGLAATPAAGGDDLAAGAIEEDSGPKGWRVMVEDEDQTKTGAAAAMEKLRIMLLDPPANRPPPRRGGRDGRDNAGDNFGEDNESRNPVNFGDIPFADIGFFEDILRSEADAVIRMIGRIENVDDQQQYICLEAKFSCSVEEFRRWIRAEDAIAFMKRISTPANANATAEGAEVPPSDAGSFDLFDEGSSPFFGGSIPLL
eukprot:gene23538-31893_t